MLPTTAAEWTVGTAPNLRFTPGGVAICDFRAVATKRKEVNGEWQDVGEIWTKVTCFKALAEHVAETVESGQRVVIIGQMEMQEWDGREGQKMTSPNILVTSIGPSLSNATAKVTKVERSGNGGGNQNRGGGNQNRGSNQQQQPSANNDPWATGGNDEPPF